MEMARLGFCAMIPLFKLAYSDFAILKKGKKRFVAGKVSARFSRVNISYYHSFPANCKDVQMYAYKQI